MLYTLDSFLERFNQVVTRGMLSDVFTKFIAKAIPSFREYTRAKLDYNLDINSNISRDIFHDPDINLNIFLDYVNRIFDRSKFQFNNLKINLTYCCVIIEPSLTPGFEVAVRSVIFRLPTWPIIIFHSEENEFFLKTLLYNVDEKVQILYQLLPFNVEDTDNYNKLLTSSWFWNRIHELGFEKILLFQSDSIMLHGNIQPFLRYDYIGAPWDFNSNILIKKYRDKGELLEGIGNGGFSLRNVNVMLDIINKCKITESVNEDVYFSLCLEKMGGYSLPNRSVGYSFCREVLIFYIKNQKYIFIII